MHNPGPRDAVTILALALLATGAATGQNFPSSVPWPLPAELQELMMGSVPPMPVPPAMDPGKGLGPPFPPGMSVGSGNGNGNGNVGNFNGNGNSGNFNGNGNHSSGNGNGSQRDGTGNGRGAR